MAVTELLAIPNRRAAPSNARMFQVLQKTNPKTDQRIVAWTKPGLPRRRSFRHGPGSFIRPSGNQRRYHALPRKTTAGGTREGLSCITNQALVQTERTGGRPFRRRRRPATSTPAENRPSNYWP